MQLQHVAVTERTWLLAQVAACACGLWCSSWVSLESPSHHQSLTQTHPSDEASSLALAFCLHSKISVLEQLKQCNYLTVLSTKKRQSVLKALHVRLSLHDIACASIRQCLMECLASQLTHLLYHLKHMCHEPDNARKIRTAMISAIHMTQCA